MRQTIISSNNALPRLEESYTAVVVGVNTEQSEDSEQNDTSELKLESLEKSPSHCWQDRSILRKKIEAFQEPLKKWRLSSESPQHFVKNG
jgi:hypothetical protein